MFDRKPHEWEVTLQSEKGEVSKVKATAHWDPNWEGVKDAIAEATAITAWLKSHKVADKRTRFLPISASLVT
jgi:hypothetical protein